MAWLWPEADSEVGGRNLRLALHHARQILTPAGAGPGDSCLYNEGGLLRLASEPPGSRASGADPTTWLDAASFEVSATQALAGRDPAACQAALSLYRGDYLPEDRGESWTAGPRRRLEELYHRLLLHLADLLGTHGEATAAEEHLRMLLAAVPLHEEAAVRLMTLLAGQGKRSEALRVYQALATTLEDDLGLPPGEEAREIRSRLLAAKALPPMTARPPRRALPDRPTNLPASVTKIVGRVWERAEVVRLLRGDATQELAPCRLLTLTGAGGVGKTRLALAVGAALVETYPDGVWLVELGAGAGSQTDDPFPVTQAVAAALGVKEEASRPLRETLTESLRPRDMLLLLDNCEHLVGACATLVSSLLRACARLTILVTSRVALGAAGEVIWTVPSLAVPPDGLVAGDTLPRYEAVQLFVVRAAAARADFVLTDQDGPAVARICRLLDGIPLAIELAAARLQLFGVREVAARLDDCFRLLIGGSRAVPPRQQSLRASLDWSYSLLDGREQALLRRLSVFAGGWTLAAAEAVCADELVPTGGVVSCLGNLTRHSLVLLEPDAEPTRYRLLEPVRQYAAEQLAKASEQAVVQDRRLAWYMGLAEEAEPLLKGPEQGIWLDRLEAEHDNLRAALAWSLTEDHVATQGPRLAGALSRFWYVRGYLSEGRRWLADVLAHGPAAAMPMTTRAQALAGAGNLARLQGDHAEARAHHERSLALFRELGDRRAIATSLNNLGLVAERQGEYAEARTFYEENRVLFRELGDRWSVAATCTNLGLVAERQGEYAEARAAYEQSIAHFRELGDQADLAHSLNNLGLVAERQGEYAEARSLHQESLTIRRALGERQGIAISLVNLGNVAVRQADYESARAVYEESLAMFRELGARGGIAVTLNNLGDVAKQQGNYERALSLNEEGLALFRELGDKGSVIEALDTLGHLWYLQGNYQRARAFYEESLTLATDLGDRWGIAKALEGFAWVAGARDKPALGAQLWSAADALRLSIGTPLPPNEQAEHEQALDEVRAALGDAAYTVAWAEGHRLSLEAAAALALADPPNGE